MHRALNTLENILWEAIICYFATYSHDNGDLSLDALPPVAVSVHLSGGDLHDEGPVHRQLALPVYDCLQCCHTDIVRLDQSVPPSYLGVERSCALVDPEDMLRSPRDAVLYVGVDLSVPVHCLHLQHLHTDQYQ